MSLLEKYGIHKIGYWISEDQDTTLICIVVHESLDSSNQSQTNVISELGASEALTAFLTEGLIVDKIESLNINKPPFSR